MISVHNLKKSFGNVQVLKGINIEIRKGECVCIIGPSGSGKSTFLRCLNLLEVPDEGEIIIEGERILEKRNGISAFQFISKHDSAEKYNSCTCKIRKMEKRRSG